MENRKAKITPRKGLSVAEAWYAPLAGMVVEVEANQITRQYHKVVSEPLCLAQNIDPYIDQDDLTFLEDEHKK